MVRLGEKGVSDIIVIAFMFILLMISAAFLLGYNSRGLDAAADRQLELKASHLQRTLERIEVRPGITVMEEAGDQLIMDQPRVEENYFRSWVENSIDFLRPSNYGVEIRLVKGPKTWSVKRPENLDSDENLLKESLISIMTTGGNLVSVEFEIELFETKLNH